MSDKTARSAASRTDSEAAPSPSLRIPLAAHLALLGHQADGPIEGAAANRLDRRLGPRARGPTAGPSASGTLFFLAHVAAVIALGDRDGELAFRILGGVFIRTI